MAAMLQQQYVVQETEPRDWAACEITSFVMRRRNVQTGLDSLFNKNLLKSISEQGNPKNSKFQSI